MPKSFRILRIKRKMKIRPLMVVTITIIDIKIIPTFIELEKYLQIHCKFLKNAFHIEGKLKRNFANFVNM